MNKSFKSEIERNPIAHWNTHVLENMNTSNFLKNIYRIFLSKDDLAFPTIKFNMIMGSILAQPDPYQQRRAKKKIPLMSKRVILTLYREILNQGQYLNIYLTFSPVTYNG